MEKLKELFRKMNEQGLFVPLFRIDGKASASFTLVVVSSLFVGLSLIGSVSKAVGGIDTQSSLYWAGLCYGLYFGRKVTGDGKTLKIDGKKDE